MLTPTEDMWSVSKKPTLPQIDLSNIFATLPDTCDECGCALNECECN